MKTVNEYLEGVPPKGQSIKSIAMRCANEAKKQNLPIHWTNINGYAIRIYDGWFIQSVIEGVR